MSRARSLAASFAAWGAILALILGGAVAACATSHFDQEVDRLADLLALHEGSTVADIGAGRGAFSLALAKRVGPSGRVYATEIDAGLRRKIERAARREGLANVVVVEAREDATGLPEGCCEAAFMRGVYHHLTKPEPTLASLHAALRPSGRFVVIDFRPTRWLALFTPKGVPANRGGHGVRPEIVEQEAEAAGFERVSLDETWPRGPLYPLYALSLRRP